LTEFKNSRLNGDSVPRLLMIAHIGHRETIAFNSIPECGVGMRNLESGDFCSSYLVHTFSEREERNLTRKVLTSDRKKRRTHQVIECVGECDTIVVWPVDRKCRTSYQQWLTERKPLYVVPVQVSHECVSIELRARALVGTEIAKSSSEVEQNRLSVTTAKNDACSVAAVTRRAFTSTWR
jgi:hypothetical protein